MRVLIVTLPLPSRHHINTMAPLAHQLKSLRALDVDVETLEIWGRAKFKYVQNWPRLRALASQVDLIHAHFGFCGWLARAQLRKPVVISFMGDDLLGTPAADGHIEPLSRIVVQVNRWLAPTMDGVIVKSEEMARVLKARSHILPNGVDLELFRPMDRLKARTLLGWAPDKRYVLFPGDPANPRKGFPLARIGVTCASQQMGEDLVIVPLKHISPDQVPLFMNACDAMVMTSFIEGSPNVVKEAMACNLPAISVPVGDVASLLTDVEGYSIVPRDGSALGNALIKTLTSNRRVNGRAALIEQGLDLVSIARRLVTIYASVIEQWKQRTSRVKRIPMLYNKSL